MSSKSVFSAFEEVGVIFQNKSTLSSPSVARLISMSSCTTLASELSKALYIHVNAQHSFPKSVGVSLKQEKSLLHYYIKMAARFHAKMKLVWRANRKGLSTKTLLLLERLTASRTTDLQKISRLMVL